MVGAGVSVTPGAVDEESPQTAYAVLAAVSLSHLLNDTLQSLLPAIYPVLKSTFDLSFAQVGLMTLALMLTASVLQPVVGLITDRRPAPMALAGGMTFTLIGLLLLSMAWTFPLLLLAAGLVGMAHRVTPSHHESRAWPLAASTAWRNPSFRLAATPARRSAHWLRLSWSHRTASAASCGVPFWRWPGLSSTLPHRSLAARAAHARAAHTEA